jgi:hypothetical protein
MLARVLIVVACVGLVAIGLTIRNWPVRCPACGQTFDSVEQREHHLRIAHTT